MPREGGTPITLWSRAVPVLRLRSLLEIAGPRENPGHGHGRPEEAALHIGETSMHRNQHDGQRLRQCFPDGIRPNLGIPQVAPREGSLAFQLIMHSAPATHPKQPLAHKPESTSCLFLIRRFLVGPQERCSNKERDATKRLNSGPWERKHPQLAHMPTPSPSLMSLPAMHQRLDFIKQSITRALPLSASPWGGGHLQVPSSNRRCAFGPPNAQAHWNRNLAGLGRMFEVKCRCTHSLPWEV